MARDLRSHKESLAAGKALRTRVPRKAHAHWQPPAHRADPVSVLVESSKGRAAELVPIRYGRMMQSPLAFYRGAAAIMAGDLAHTAESGIRVQVCGDCHLLNFGGYATPERNVVFDLNDFDETLPAPWEWDVKRLAASFVVAGRHNGFSKRQAHETAWECVRSYRERMGEYAGMGVLDRWYQRIDTADIIRTIPTKKWKQLVRRYVAKAVSRSVLEDAFPKLVAMRGGKPRIKDNPPLIFHGDIATSLGREGGIRRALENYRRSLRDERRELLDRYEVQDVAAKVVGVGSVGTRCGILLMMAGPDDVLFLQIKEARPSVLEPFAGKSRFRSRGQRVVAGQRLMQAASDLFLGWTEVGDRHFYIRQLRDAKITPVIETHDAQRMRRYAGWCGWALARAHAKAGDAVMISGYLGGSARFEDAVSAFAVAYADQNERDHQALLAAIRSGKIRVRRE